MLWQKIFKISSVLGVASFLMAGLVSYAPAAHAQNLSCNAITAPWALATPSSGPFACQKDSSFSKSKYTTIQTVVEGGKCPQNNCAICKAGETCTRLADCETTYASQGYSCGSNKADNAAYECIFYHCPGGGDNVCCRKKKAEIVPVATTPEVTPAPEEEVTVTVSDCCKSIVPQLPRDPATGLLAEGAHYTLNDVVQTAINIYECILCLVGALIFIMVVAGGIVLLVSGGSSERVSLGKKIIASAVVGGIIAFATYLIIYWTIKAVGGKLVSNSELKISPGIESTK